MLLCTLVLLFDLLVAGSLTVLCSDGCPSAPSKRWRRRVSRKAARQAFQRSKKARRRAAARQRRRRRRCPGAHPGSGWWLALLGVVWRFLSGFFLPEQDDVQQQTVLVRCLDGKTVALQASDRSTMTVGALKATLATETTLPADKQRLVFPGSNFAEVPDDAVLSSTGPGMLAVRLLLKDGVAGGGGGNSKAKAKHGGGGAKEETFFDVGGGGGGGGEGSAEEEFAGFGIDGAGDQKEAVAGAGDAAAWKKKVAALEKENKALKKETKRIPALEKEVTTLKKETKRMPALEKENTALKKEIKKMKGGGSSGTFTTSTGLSDQQLLAIAMGDGDKDKTVVAKSVQEQREEASAREAKAAAMVAKLLPGGKVPEHTQLWLDGKQDEVDDDKMRAQAVAPAEWLLEVLQHAYLDPRLHDAAGALLRTRAFTSNLGFLQQYAPLQQGLAAFLRTFGGDRMRTIYDDHGLGTLLADAEVRAVLGAETGQRSQQAVMAELFEGLAFATPADRFVNEQVALHVVLMVSRAADPGFQRQVGAIAAVLAQSETGFGSGPVKQFQRPLKKALTDYAAAAHPRVGCNLDPIRCLVAARDVQSLFRVMRALRGAFGAFPKWKNLFAASAEAREARHHLASIMITVPFSLGKTYGDLAADPAVQAAWDAYCEAPEGVPLERWRRDTAAARAILASKRVANIPAVIYGEVQLLLESYVQVRGEIHAAYEFLRAPSEKALWEEAVLSAGRYRPAADEDTVYNAAYEGQREVAATLLAAGADVDGVGDADGATPAYIASQQGHLDVLEVLVGAGADVNAADKAGKTPVFMASWQGHSDVVKFLIDAKADVNAKASSGNTALTKAIGEGHEDVIAVLKAAGAK